MIQAEVDRIMTEARAHLRFMVSMYWVRLKAGRHVIHEHPPSASPSQDDSIRALLDDPHVGSVIGHQCRFGLTTKSKDGTRVPALKPTSFAASSLQMLARLDVTRDRSHKHEWRMGGNAAAAAF